MATGLFPLAASQAQGPEQPYYGPDLAVRLICPDCRDPIPNIVEEFSSGDLVCGTCGLVLGDRVVDTRSEWRTFANDEGDDPSRVGAALDPLLEGVPQLDTVIGFMDGGSGVARDLQRAASRAQGSKSSRSILSVFRDISTMCDQLSLTKTVSDIAKQLYKRINEEKILRGKPIEAIVAACIFVACRQANVPRTFKEMHQFTRVNKKALQDSFKVIRAHFDLQSGAPTDGLSGPEDLLVRYCSYLALPEYVQGYCREIIVAAREHNIAAGRNPMSIAGGAIYFACRLLGVEKSIPEIGAVAGASDAVIRLMYKLYLAEKVKLVKKVWLENGRARMDRLTSA